MQRRQFFSVLAAGGLWSVSPNLAFAVSERPRKLLVLIELKGGNDGLNTLVPYADPNYLALRPRIGVRREDVIQLDDRRGLHPALEALLPSWKNGELAWVESLGYPQPNLSHFRSIEIWDTASASTQYLDQGWLGRAFAAQAVPRSFVADGALVGSSDLGPLQGARAIALKDPEQFRRQARYATGEASEMASGPAKVMPSALSHVLKLESEVKLAASGLVEKASLNTHFPEGAFGNTVRTACRVLAAGDVAVLRLTLSGFDTHQNQSGAHANLLRQLGEGLLALRSGLQELGRWDDSLIMSYGEFGRRAHENQSGGTDHGTAAPHFVMGGKVRGGIYGTPPALDRLDGNGNLPFGPDFRSLYATVLERWWGQDASAVLGGKFKPLELLKA